MTQIEWIKKNDFHLYLLQGSIPEARKKMISETGTKCTPVEFKKLRVDHCLFWRVLRKWNHSLQRDLDDDGWDTLQKAARDLRKKMQGMEGLVSSDTEASKLISSFGLPTNPKLVQGLSRRFKWWATV